MVRSGKSTNDGDGVGTEDVDNDVIYGDIDGLSDLDSGKDTEIKGSKHKEYDKKHRNRIFIDPFRGVYSDPYRNVEFEVHEGPCKFVVSLESKTYSYEWWDRNGLPCKHAASAIGYKRDNIEDCGHEDYHISNYLKVYEGAIHPIPQKDLEPDDEFPTLDLPPLKRQPGRPRQARRRKERKPTPTLKRKKECY
ncbi:hypothetical protein GH714_020245 [Hevea brasiliensis]|uniref:Zinc finger PMZ-type domain-containing protein n=1 Tax=Hevea brasiliensis TaxID=3981 RepID=A0A6A6LAY0_HEVBR|nr:hypothetical protein GH714_020245 [Hevea brasiliensis]